VRCHRYGGDIGIGSAVPLGELARNLYSMNSKVGNGWLDFSSVVKLLTNTPEV